MEGAIAQKATTPGCCMQPTATLCIQAAARIGTASQRQDLQITAASLPVLNASGSYLGRPC